MIFNSRTYRKPLSAGLGPDPLVKLTVLPDPLGAGSPRQATQRKERGGKRRKGTVGQGKGTRFHTGTSLFPFSALISRVFYITIM